MRALALLKLTVPGPLTWLHVVVSTGGMGSPSSMAAPVKVAMPGSVITWSRPAFTTGARLGRGSHCARAGGVGTSASASTTSAQLMPSSRLMCDPPQGDRHCSPRATAE